MNVHIRACLENDIDALQRIGYETFDETFRPMNTDETMDKYLAKAFNRERLLSELRMSGCAFYFLYSDDCLAGYVKLNEAPAQSDIRDPQSLEIERIYVWKTFAGKGYGKTLMNYALEQAAKMKKKYVWLGVWEKNEKALGFYRKMGFREAGRHVFRMGDELQTDYIMRKDVE